MPGPIGKGGLRMSDQLRKPRGIPRRLMDRERFYVVGYIGRRWEVVGVVTEAGIEQLGPEDVTARADRREDGGLGNAARVQGRHVAEDSPDV